LPRQPLAATFCNASLSATATATPPTLAPRRNRHLHPHSLRSTNSMCRALERASRFFRRCNAALARRVAIAPPPSPAFGKASVAAGTSARSPPQLTPCISHAPASSALSCHPCHFASSLARGALVSSRSCTAGPYRRGKRTLRAARCTPYQRLLRPHHLHSVSTPRTAPLGISQHDGASQQHWLRQQLCFLRSKQHSIASRLSSHQG
jgi:hypothetical protein